MSFVHLHTHSHYSLLDGLPKIDELVARAKELGMNSLALTDHGVLYGAIEFYQKAKKQGLKPIIGMEAYLAPFGMHQKRPKIDTNPYHLVLLAKNEQGYKNLIKLTTLAHLEGFYYKPRIDKELLKKYSKGLIGLSGCLDGEIPRLILSNQIKKAEEKALEYQEIFQKDFYLELEDHPRLENQIKVNQILKMISTKCHIPLVATNDIHYLYPEDAEAQDILLCIQTQKKVQDKDRLCMLGEDFSMKSAKQMEKAFQDVPEAVDNTGKIAEMCNLEIKLKEIKLPHFEVPKGYTVNSYLEKLCQERLKKRYKTISQKILNRLKHELSVIKKIGFAGYFLIVYDIVKWAKSQNIVVGPGRGSASGSLVSYLLDITDIDPIKYNLFFERFLNPERITMPDIDLDFTDTRRDEVIEYVKKKYGSNRVAQIITFGTMAARACLRDTGRVLGYPYSFCDQIAKMIPMDMTLEEAKKKIPDLKTIYAQDPQARKLLDQAKKLEGVARHASTHACGVVITPDDIDNYVPRQHPSSEDKTIITQYELHAIEDLGLLKMDFLGLKNLTILENATKIIEKTKNLKINVNTDEIPYDDPATFKLLSEAKTTGVFQLESSGMKRYLPQLKPSKFEDIIAMVALYRPGPIEWISDFIEAKQGKKEISYLHPKLKPILEPTYGIIVYQEQVMQIARDLAGFSLSEADTLRKAVGKKIHSLLIEQKEKFVQGCIKNGISKDISERLFTFIEPFARYGFNKAHATGYALIAYWTAYLKTHFPVEFMAALMSADQKDIDKIASEVQECKDLGIEVLPPDVNESFANFTVIKKGNQEAIRFGMSAIKNLGSNTIKDIISSRKKGGKFESLDDFINRIPNASLNKKSLESLIKSGALDQLGERGQMLFNLTKILDYSKIIHKARMSGQVDLFGLNKAVSCKLRLDKAKPASKKEKLSWEKELLGLYITEHPVFEYLDCLKRKAVPLKEITKNIVGKQVSAGGIITKIQKIVTKTNEPMLFVKLEDLTSEIEVLVFPSILKQTLNVWQEGKVILVEGRVNDRDGVPKILCSGVKELTPNLEPQKGDQPKTIQIIIPKSITSQKLAELKNILKATSGNLKVFLKILDEEGLYKKIKTNYKVDYNQNLAKQLENIIGKGNIQLV